MVRIVISSFDNELKSRKRTMATKNFCTSSDNGEIHRFRLLGKIFHPGAVRLQGLAARHVGIVRQTFTCIRIGFQMTKICKLDFC